VAVIKKFKGDKMVSIYFKKKINSDGEIEKTCISFKGKNQLPLIMVIKEYWNNNEVVFADCLFSTNIRIGKFWL
jgi:hypothetical protein